MLTVKDAHNLTNNLLNEKKKLWIVCVDVLQFSAKSRFCTPFDDEFLRGVINAFTVLQFFIEV